jgi:hypothetical protein
MNGAASNRPPAMFASPSGTASALRIPPRLATWMKKDHPDQVRLGAYLDSLDPLVRPILEADEGPLVLELSVGLPDEQSLLTGGRDLDNFLSPIVHRFGPKRFVAAIGRKVQGTSSTLRVGPARPADEAIVSGWKHAAISTTVDDMTPAWKQELAAALPADTRELRDGPVELQVSLRGARQKLVSGNWHEYWKPTVDALSRILGEENPARPYHPRDDRITSLGFHRVIEGEGKAIQIELWWRTAPTLESSQT